MSRYCLPLLASLALATAARAAELQLDAPGVQHDIVFAQYSPLSRSVELARRMLSPLANLEIARVSANLHKQLREQGIDLAQETFAVYIPAHAPPRGYGVLSFIAPWQKAAVPAAWLPILDEHGMIFVSAARSGNEENILDRRIPLALLGAYNIMQRYPIDKERVYVGGLSGGSRVAMRAALSYPDVFRGAILNAGSDPIGNSQVILPPPDLFEQFQSSSRLIYVTGTFDSWNMEHDVVSEESLNTWCVFGTVAQNMQGAGHELASAAALDRALRALSATAALDAAKISSCRERTSRQLAAKLQQVKDLVEHGKTHEAWQLLIKIDARYGGLAQPDSVELAQRIGERH